MKKIVKPLVYLTVLLLALCLTACSNNQEQTPDITQQQETTPSDEQQPPQESSATLVAYFSRTGNTETVAQMIAEQLGADLYAITPAEAYPQDYQQALAVAEQEQADNARPQLAESDIDIAAYDTVLIGYPIWYGYEPMLIRTFIETYDFSGKVVAPFCTSGGSTISASEQSLAELLPESTLLTGLTVNGSSAGDAADQVASWLIDNGLLVGEE